MMNGEPVTAARRTRPSSVRAARCALKILFWVWSGLASLLVVEMARADSFPEMTVTIQKSAEAASCASESQLLSRSQIHQVVASGSANELRVNVRITREGDDFTALVQVSGPREGTRKIRAPGPTCADLEDGLLLALELLAAELPPLATPAEPPSEASAPRGPEPSHAQPPAERDDVAFWIGGGAALTQGLPYKTSAAPFIDLLLTADRWTFGASGFATSTSEVPLAPGSIRVHALGAQASGCWTVLMNEARSLRFQGCVLAAVSALDVETVGFPVRATDQQPWIQIGAGAQCFWYPSRRAGVGVSVKLFETLQRHSFSVPPLGQYVNDQLVGWFAISGQFQVW